jgi:hypothetical protein
MRQAALTFVALASLLAAPAALAEAPAPGGDGAPVVATAEIAPVAPVVSVAPVAEDCFNCSKGDSTDDCKGFDQCRGTREHCRKIGCKIVGTASCSTAANVKICEWDGSSIELERAEAAAVDLGMCTP